MDLLLAIPECEVLPVCCCGLWLLWYGYISLASDQATLSFSLVICSIFSKLFVFYYKTILITYENEKIARKLLTLAVHVKKSINKGTKVISYKFSVLIPLHILKIIGSN